MGDSKPDCIWIEEIDHIVDTDDEADYCCNPVCYDVHIGKILRPQTFAATFPTLLQSCVYR